VTFTGPTIPTPGTYLLHEESMSAWGCAGGGSFTARWYADVLGRAACGGPHIEVVFRPYNAPTVRRTIRIAFDGSFRDIATFLPVNILGETRPE
jgi:hypothetical protein